MRRIPLTIFIIDLPLISISSQGFNIPAKHWGLSFGNSTRFDGIRFNLTDKDIEKINGISIGIPAAMGTNYRNGINIGLLGAGAGNDVKGSA